MRRDMRDEFRKDAAIDEAIHGKRRCSVVMAKTLQNARRWKLRPILYGRPEERASRVSQVKLSLVKSQKGPKDLEGGGGSSLLVARALASTS